MFSIGEFSRLTGLTVKTLRFYHDQGLLEPSHVEAGSGYRFYAETKIETARIITALRDMEFSIADIKDILRNYDDDADIVQFLENQKLEIEKRIRNDRRITRMLSNIIIHEREAITTMSKNEYKVEEKHVEPTLVASLPMQGKYSDCGKGFSQIGRKFGRHICGKSMMLCHDSEYKENANYEVAMPVRKGESKDSIEVKEIPGGRCLSLMHLGPYDEISRSYEKIIKHAKANNLQYSLPTREIYHKGPGMIFRGNPKKYLTEIQFLIVDAGDKE